MKRRYLLSGMAVASVLALGAPQGRADSDVDEMDHSRLNHGVFGLGTPQGCGDSDVDGMDHSHLGHGVLGKATHDEMHETHHHTDAASSDVSPASPPPPLK